MTIELKIKNKHLTEEARIIRWEERKLKAQAKWLRLNQRDDKEVHAKFMSLQGHRKWEVRNEQRATFLARAFMNGTPYLSVESKCHETYKRDTYIAKRVATMVNKYGSKTVVQSDIVTWFNA